MKKKKSRNDELNNEILYGEDPDDGFIGGDEDFEDPDSLPDPTQMDFEKVKSSYFGTSDWTGGLPDTAKVNEILLAQKQKKEKERILNVVHTVLFILFFSGITLCLVEFGSVRPMNLENFYARFAMIFFLGILWTLQRVKLFNLPSLFLSLAFAPYAVFYPLVNGKSPEDVMIIVVELITRWMILMLLTDLVLAKKIRIDQRYTVWTFLLLCVTCVFTMMNGNRGSSSVVFLYLVIMCFIPILKKEWVQLTDCLIYAQVFSFVVVTIFTFTGNPWVILPREFYIRPDDLAQFYGLCLALATYGLIHFAKKYGRISFSYFLCAAWLIATLVMAFYKGADGILPGAIFMLFIAFLFAPRIRKFPFALIRPIIALVVIGLMTFGIISFANMIMAESFDTAVFAQNVMKSPLQYSPGLAEDIIGKVENVHRGGGAYGDLIQSKTIGAFLNVFLDSRIGIFFETLGALNWDGHILVGVDADSFVMATKFQFVQFLYEFGYLAGAVNILFVLVMWVTSVVMHVRYRKEYYLLPMVLGAMTLGVWTCTSSGIFYPIGMFFYLSLYPLWVDIKVHKQHAKDEKAEKNKKSEKTEKKEKSEKTEKAEKAGKKLAAAGQKEDKPVQDTVQESKKNKKDKTKKEVVSADTKEIRKDTESDKVTETEEPSKAERTEKTDKTKKTEKTEKTDKKEKSNQKEKAEKVAELNEANKEKKPHLQDIEKLPEEEKKPKKRGFTEVEGRPLDRSLLEDEEIIQIDLINQDDSAD